MAKCALVGCNEKPVGGFMELLDAGSFDSPNATIPGLKTAWCKTHEDMLRPSVLGKRGVWLKGKALE
jgi:hypothetical protein